MATTSRFGGQPSQENHGHGSGQLDNPQPLTDRTKEGVSAAIEKGREGAADLARKAGDLASNVGQRAGEAVSTVGSQMKSLAGTIREKAPHDGLIGDTAGAVADSLEAGGRYLEDRNLSHIGHDITGIVRRYPLQALMVGIGLGFLLARATRS